MSDILVTLMMGVLVFAAGVLFMSAVIGFSVALADLIRYIHDRWVQ